MANPKNSEFIPASTTERDGPYSGRRCAVHSGNLDLGTINESPVGETESDTFMPDSSVYLFIVGEQEGNPGQLEFKYTR